LSHDFRSGKCIKCGNSKEAAEYFGFTCSADKKSKPWENSMETNITTIVLGPSGSGKTVFMASMYTYLLDSFTKNGFCFQASDETDKKFRDIHHELSSGKDWPPPTAGGQEYSFDLRAYSEGITKDVSRVKYWDYTGQWIIGGTDTDSSFKTALRNSNILLCLLDGRSIVNEIKTGKSEIAKTISALSARAQDTSNIAPLQFIVTKWDHVLENKITLSQVSELLKKQPAWANLMRLCQDRKSNARLIPVSSVGEKFCKWNGHEFEIIPHSVPTPINLHLPFCFAFTQLLQSKLENAGKMKQQASAKSRSPKWWEYLLDLVDDVLDKLDDIIPGPPIAKPVVKKIIKIIAGEGAKSRAEMDREFQEIKDGELANADQETRFYASLIYNLSLSAKEFEEMHPEAILKYE